MIFQTEPSGACTQWKANAIGRNAGTLREYLEKKWEADLDEETACRLAIETLLECVEGADNIEIAIIRADKTEMMDEEKLANIYNALKEEKEAAELAKKKKAD